MMTDEFYNVTNFPHFVAHNGNWDIYANDRGYCASIPVVEGCRATAFGPRDYVRVTLGVDPMIAVTAALRS